MPESIFVKPGMYIMTPEPISMAYFINPPNQSHPLIVARQRLDKTFLAANTHAKKRQVGIPRSKYYDNIKMDLE
jgi:hypothetical protein